ncbi:hypothetical protein DVA67_015530 [Solirubrobacter sp. CPCC 204708]|uniref:PhoU domain-containing protein n=1 Tax=Solirubrobacter deserti TaxID=2282478 RepID=A0ABT4RNV9_9ACTN|nr:PhoU domain-containing protein [Solirubrobacter deserti]MBE2317393.1 hypothetical protein [Solirubrobacter deserti]MDA0139975.1 hypothetical protein [Solirubrobacter deserti]
MSLPTVREPYRRVARSPLEAGLAEAEARVLEELAAEGEWVKRAVAAATACDTAAAEQLSAEHEQLERCHTAVHDRLLSVLALQAPVAGDLRLAIALLHVNERLERIGAQCANIGTMCTALPPGVRPSETQLQCFGKMAELAQEQLSDARTVFAERDIDGARRMLEHDRQINEANRRCFAIAVHANCADERTREVAFMVAMMARALERIGDNAVDIARQAAFVATGRFAPAA